MTRLEAESIAHDLYPEHRVAATELILQATDPCATETRRRAAIALSFLDPDRPLPAADLLALLECVIYAHDQEVRTEAVEELTR